MGSLPITSGIGGLGGGGGGFGAVLILAITYVFVCFVFGFVGLVFGIWLVYCCRPSWYACLPAKDA